MTARRWLYGFVLFFSLFLPGFASGSEPGPSLGSILPLWSALPFAGILLSIALFPLLAPKFWHHHFGKVSAFWGLVLAIPFVLTYGGVASHSIVHIMLLDYLPFIILLWALFTVAGGIYVSGDLQGKPAINVALLAIGTLLSSLIGTTGSAMVMIRPVLKTNMERKHKTHVIVFFIFLVANIGGSLTPLGDPPLFLGFLHHVPFFWTLNLLGPMALAGSILLVLFFFIDRHFYRKEATVDLKVDQAHVTPIRIHGKRNFLFLAGIVGGVLLSGFWKAGSVHFLGTEMAVQNLTRDFILLVMGGLSLYFTPRQVRKNNQFSWGPIQEVAILFAGIFVTIIPAIEILKAGTGGALAFLIRAIREPAHYFWAAGTLSSFLDNAPTYLTFMNTALGQFFAGMPEPQAVALLTTQKKIFLEAVSAGAVFMGANTYIGNAPNFMVKAIAEECGVKMPSFFGYIARWSLPILIPVFILITVVFF